MPLVSDGRQPPTDLVSEALAELHCPLPHGLMADQDAAGHQHLLDHPRAERESKIEPDGMADHFSQKAVMGIVRVMGRVHPSRMPRSGHPPVNLTVPSEGITNPHADIGHTAIVRTQTCIGKVLDGRHDIPVRAQMKADRS
jgi:hypothetical protein